MNRKKIAEQIIEKWNKYSLGLDAYFAEIEQFRQMYRAEATNDPEYPWDYQLIDPKIFPLIRTNLSRFSPMDAKLLLQATNEEWNIHRVKNQAIINWEISQDEFELAFYKCILAGLISGIGYLEDDWLYRKAKVYKTIHGEKQLSEPTNRAIVRHVRTTDVVVPDRNVPTLAEQTEYIQRVNYRLGDLLDENEALEELGQKPKWDKKLLKLAQESDDWYRKSDYEFEPKYTQDENNSPFVRNRVITCYKYCNLDNDVLIVPAEKPETLLNTKWYREKEHWHDGYCLIDFHPFPEDERYDSMGVVKPVKDLQIAASDILNNYLTSAKQSTYSMWIAGTAAAQTPDWQFVSRPNAVIRVAGDVNQVQPIRSADNSQGTAQMRRELDSSFETATSFSSLYQSGASGATNISRTATGAKIIDQNLDQNLQLIVSLFGTQVLQKIGDRFLALNSQYITEEQVISITGSLGDSEFIKVSPEEISANYKVRAIPERIVKTSQQMKQASLLNYLNMIASFDGKYINLQPVIKAISNTYNELDGVAYLFPDPENDAREVIRLANKGILAKTSSNQDHKKIIAIINKEILDLGENINPEALSVLYEYIEDCRRWIDATDPKMLNNIMGIEQEQMLAQQAMQQQPMQMPMGETALENSLANQGNVNAIPMPENMGGLDYSNGERYS